VIGILFIFSIVVDLKLQDSPFWGQDETKSWVTDGEDSVLPAPYPTTEHDRGPVHFPHSHNLRT